jgi:hypothetical protein
MNKMIKEYKLANGIMDDKPVKNGTDSDFRNYRKETKSTTWVLIVNNTMKYLTQINLKKEFYAGYMTEPYILFLKNSKFLNNILIKIEKEFVTSVETSFSLSENFQLKILNQELYDRFVNTKICLLISLIMSV